jgi:hypothetical protein
MLLVRGRNLHPRCLTCLWARTKIWARTKLLLKEDFVGGQVKAMGQIGQHLLLWLPLIRALS